MLHKITHSKMFAVKPIKPKVKIKACVVFYVLDFYSLKGAITEPVCGNNYRVKLFFHGSGHCGCSWPEPPTGVLSAQFWRLQERSLRDKGAFVQFRVPAGVPPCTLSPNLPLTFMMMTFLKTFFFPDYFSLKGLFLGDSSGPTDKV